MLLELPSNIKQVTSHISWMKENLHFLEGSKGKPYVERLLNTRLVEIDKALELANDDNIFGEYNTQNPKYASYFANWLNHASTSCYLGELEKAQSILEKLQVSLKKLSTIDYHGRILKGIKYVLGGMTWCVTALQSRANEECTQLLQQWEIIREDNVALATIEFLKGSLAGYLGIAAESSLAHYRKSVELDPEYFVWYHYLFRKLRETRRNQKFSNHHKQQQFQSGPTREEREIVEMAYETCVNITGEMNLLSLSDLVMAMKENLNALVANAEAAQMNEWNKENEAEYQKCWDLLSQGMKIAKENDLPNWISTIMILQAEFLLYLKPCDPEKQEKGKQLLFECLDKYPGGRIHYQIGKLYQQEANLDVTQVWRLRKAHHHFAESLKLDPANFGCLRGYMKLLNIIPDRQNDDYRDSLDTLRKCITVARTDYQLAELHMYLGCVIWIYNPEYIDHNKQMACRAWLYVAKNLPEFLDDLIKHLAHPPFKVSYKKMRREPVYINIKRIMSELIELRKEYQFAKDKISVGHIDVFYDKLVPYVDTRNNGLWPEEGCSTACGNDNVYSTVNEEMSQVVIAPQRRRNKQDHNNTRLNLKCDKSLADMDNNWRSGK